MDEPIFTIKPPVWIGVCIFCALAWALIIGGLIALMQL